MASVAAVLPVPANANTALLVAAKPADDDFRAVLASYAPAQDLAMTSDVAKSDTFLRGATVGFQPE
ncbi:MAG: hypothetical protein WDM89_03480 [Rhizomicrobium sp.]